MTEEWDQERADFRSFESVRLIALDVLDFADDDDPVVWYAYAAQHHLTVNEVVYYLNAYEAGDISLGKAAQMLGISQEEMKDVLREVGAAIHLGPRSVEELLEDASNA